MRTTCKYFVFYLLYVLLISCDVKSSEVFSTDEGAIRGFDPVAYFKEARPVKGEKHFSFEWNNATWRFSSEANLEEFKTNPLKYAPQYGGYCAYGVADGHKSSTQPDAWTIVDNKLYLNYDEGVKASWMEHQTKFILKADSNWSTVKLMSDL